MQQLSPLCDLIGLRSFIVQRTPRGKSQATDPWQHCRDFLAAYAPTTDPAAVLAAFERAGVRGDVAAARWLLQHDELVP